jgi:E3 ubiquitin-protein ligase TRIP12
LNQAVTILSEHAGVHSTMEYEYEGEAGIGLGPTLEFYTLGMLIMICCNHFIVSREIQKKELGLWYSSSTKSESDYITTEFGLFPNFKLDDAQVSKFHFVGQLVGKVLEDNRLLSMHFTTPFLKVIQGYDYIDLINYQHVDSYIYNSVKSLIDMCTKLQNGNLDETAIANMSLDFTFQGVELKKDGGMVDVDGRNFSQYVEQLCAFLERECFKSAASEFRRGMYEVFDLAHLSSFTDTEFRSLICGNESLWNTPDIITRNIICTHGYDAFSPQINDLISIICELTPDLQRLFLEFVTGSTQLPVGGFPALSPKLTIAKREGSNPDDMLPTCNTCFHYLKLPEYSSREVMRNKLLIAVTLGRGSFELT